MLCAVIKTPSIQEIEAANQEADYIELRLDEMGPLSFSAVQSLRKACKKPVIFKGGLQVIDWLGCVPEYVDLPFAAPLKLFEQVKSDYPALQRICSWHDFEKTPEQLDRVFERPAEIYKVTTMAHSTLDALRMLLFVKEASRPVVGLCMGEEGMITRILAPLFGSPFTYAPLNEAQRTAPGQLLLKELKQRYHHHSLHSETALYGLIGDPVSKSPSHQTHNFAFSRLGVDAIYVKLKVTKEELPAFFSLALKLNFKGFSVTMPLKEAVLPFLGSVHDSVGAINTIQVKEGQLEGWNTDGIGALAAIEKQTVVLCKHVVILGAGGVARAIAKEAVRRGATVTLLNRTVERAQRVAKELECKAASLADFPLIAQQGYDVLINCTPVGMEDYQIPIDPRYLLTRRVVMDAISTPSLTPLLEAAKSKKCRLIGGMDLFIQQAVEQFCVWFSPCVRESLKSRL